MASDTSRVAEALAIALSHESLGELVFNDEIDPEHDTYLSAVVYYNSGSDAVIVDLPRMNPFRGVPRRFTITVSEGH